MRKTQGYSYESSFHMKILAVDDDPLILDLLEVSLVETSFKDIVSTASAEEALALLDALDGPNCAEGDGSFDIFLLDIQMPGMNGIDLCRKIRSRLGYKNAPIIMITSLNDRSHVVEAFSAGATDYITKPFDGLELVSRIRLAQMIVEDRKKVLESYFEGLAGESSRTSYLDAYFRQPALLDGPQNLTDYRVLETFLLKLGRKALSSSVAVGLKLDNAKEILSQSGPGEFEKAIKLTAGAIDTGLGGEDCLVSYLGSGYFILIIRRSNLTAGLDISSAINDSIQTNKDTLGDLSITISAGDPIDCNDLIKCGIEELISKSLKTLETQVEGEKKNREDKAHLTSRAWKFNVWSD
jgi:DNA-binding response OmpR family regulator